MVAVLGEEVVCGASKFFGNGADDSLNLFVGGKSEAVEDLALERSAWRFGLGLGPVDTGEAGMVMSAISILFSVYNDARMEKGGPDSPEHRRDAAWLQRPLAWRRPDSASISLQEADRRH